MERRNTIQQDLVLNALKSLANHPTADEIYEYIIQSYPSVGRGTVYRNLNKLADTGRIRRVCVPGGADHFDHTLRNHYHVKCTCCDRVYDVDMDVIENLMDMIKDTHGFEITDYDIAFQGICPACLKLSQAKDKENSTVC